MPSARSRVAQLRDRDLVLRRDVGDRAVDFGVVDPDAAVARVGDLHALVDQRVDDLLAQIVVRRQPRAAARRILLHARHALLHLAGGDELRLTTATM